VLRPLACLAAAATVAFAVMTASIDAQSLAPVPGARIFYSDTGGGGIPVVLLHAATGSSAVWEHQLPAFTKAGFRVIAYDRRGFGRTTIDPAGPQPGTGADDLQALADHLQLRRFHLVATAAGAFVALDYVLSFPDRLRSLVIANSIGAVQDADYLALGQRLRPPEFAKLPPDFRELSPSYRAANPEGTRRWLELERTNRPEGAKPVTQEMKNVVTFARLETIRTPTLLLTGDADLYAPPAVMRLFTARIANAESVVIAEAGHSAYWEQPERFNEAVLAFLRKH
jgi:pimeloyl-ACP methyl ester carboxylesterase